MQYELHHGVQKLVADLNALYRDNPALHYHDFEPQGFEWIDCHDAPQSILSYLRRSNGQTLIMVINFTPVVRLDYRIGVPYAGGYQEVFNSDSAYYGGSNAGNSGYLESRPEPWMNRPHSLIITLPPLAVVVLKAP